MNKGIECDISVQTEEILVLGNYFAPSLLRILKLPHMFLKTLYMLIFFSFLQVLYGKDKDNLNKYEIRIIPEMSLGTPISNNVTYTTYFSQTELMIISFIQHNLLFIFIKSCLKGYCCILELCVILDHVRPF